MLCRLVSGHAMRQQRMRLTNIKHTIMPRPFSTQRNPRQRSFFLAGCGLLAVPLVSNTALTFLDERDPFSPSKSKFRSHLNPAQTDIDEEVFKFQEELSRAADPIADVRDVAPTERSILHKLGSQVFLGGLLGGTVALTIKKVGRTVVVFGVLLELLNVFGVIRFQWGYIREHLLFAEARKHDHFWSELFKSILFRIPMLLAAGGSTYLGLRYLH
eukprot:GILK01001950.1.p1 GENE.GILK01001950.1~~GILK01001950.1.p1  ORF type:complete len:215 (+),score=20.78 GILK01001950.1:42-686(+)